jgi:hypothetical protein
MKSGGKSESMSETMTAAEVEEEEMIEREACEMLQA